MYLQDNDETNGRDQQRIIAALSSVCNIAPVVDMKHDEEALIRQI